MRIRTLAFSILLVACGGRESAVKPVTIERPSILLVTLDTTRADAIGRHTPSFNALAAKGRVFAQAYATTPQTLPSHASMLTGLYPAGHGIHENARYLDARHALVQEALRTAGYRTAAFVSAFPLDRRFGLARGFETYDDALPAGANERSARETTDRALAWLVAQASGPVFLWVHFFEPHSPYEPPVQFRAESPYLGEVAAMDAELGRLVETFRRRGETAVIVAGDHGEGLGDHGEAEHGNLVYQSTMHVPLLLAGPGIDAGVERAPVSTRRIHHTILDWAGLASEHSLRRAGTEVVLGEAMIPFLQFGWQPQIMAVDGAKKVIHAGRLELYDVVADPKETTDLYGKGDLSRGTREALRTYPIPSLAAARPSLNAEEERRLASLGYLTSDTKPVVRKDAPRPVEMVELFDELDRVSLLFADGRYAQSIPLFETILAKDPHNLMAALRLAASHSALGNEAAASAAFGVAERIAPDSPDVRLYLALHYARGKEWPRAAAMLERIVAETPQRLPAVEALAGIREKQNRLPEALALWRRVAELKSLSASELNRAGQLAMAVGDTAFAIETFEKARALEGAAFRNHLELGVLYLAARRFIEAREALDRVPPSHPAYPMALFKRAQLSVLLNEPDRIERIARARQHADDSTRLLIEREALFR